MAGQSAEVKEFQFKLTSKIQLFPPDQKLCIDVPLSLVSCASKYGLIFAAYPAGILCLSSNSITVPTDSKKNPSKLLTDIPRREVPLGTQPTHLGVSADHELLAVATIIEDIPVLQIYLTTSFTSMNIVKKVKMMMSYNGGVRVRDLQWNPGVANMIGAVLSDGSAVVFEIKDTSFTLNCIPPNAQATCLCWSPKGKQVVIGASNGSLTQYKPELKAVKTCGPPAPGRVVVSVHWLSSFQFVTAYCNSQSPDEKPVLVVVNVPKNAPVSYIPYEDICFPVLSKRPEYYFIHQQTWNVLLVGCGDSMDVSVLADMNGQWVHWKQDDSDRAELPPAETTRDDVHNVGIALDTSPSQPIPINESQVVAPMPVMLAMSHSGVLCAFTVLNLTPNAAPICSPPQPLPDQSGVSAFTVPKVQTQITETMASPQTVSSGPSQTGPAAQPVQQAPPPATVQPVAPQPAALQLTLQPPASQPAAPQQAAPQPLSSQLAPTQPVASQPSSIPAPVFQLGQSLTMGLNQTGTVTSASAKPPATFVNFTLGGPTTTSAPTPTPATSTQPAPQQTSSSSLTSFAPLPAFATQATAKPGLLPTPSTSSNTASSSGGVLSFGNSKPFQTLAPSSSPAVPSLGLGSGVAEPSPVRNEKPAEIPVPTATFTNVTSETKKEEPKVPEIDSSVYKRAIYEELSCFSEEMAALRQVLTSSDVTICEQKVKGDLVTERESVENFTSELVETMRTLQGEVSALRFSLLEIISWLEAIKTTQQLRMNPRLIEMRGAEDLDPLSKQRLKKIEEQLYYLQSQIRQAASSIDAARRKRNGHKGLVVPTYEVVLQTINNHTQILNLQKSRIAKIEEELSDRVKSLQRKREAFSDISIFSPNKTSISDSQLSTLAQKLLETKLNVNEDSAENSKITVVGRKKLSTDKKQSLINWCKRHTILKNQWNSQKPPLSSTFLTSSLEQSKIDNTSLLATRGSEAVLETPKFSEKTSDVSSISVKSSVSRNLFPGFNTDTSLKGLNSSCVSTGGLKTMGELVTSTPLVAKEKNTVTVLKPVGPSPVITSAPAGNQLSSTAFTTTGFSNQMSVLSGKAVSKLEPPVTVIATQPATLSATSNPPTLSKGANLFAPQAIPGKDQSAKPFFTGFGSTKLVGKNEDGSTKDATFGFDKMALGSTSTEQVKDKEKEATLLSSSSQSNQVSGNNISFSLTLGSSDSSNKAAPGPAMNIFGGKVAIPSFGSVSNSDQSAGPPVSGVATLLNTTLAGTASSPGAPVTSSTTLASPATTSFPSTAPAAPLTTSLGTAFTTTTTTGSSLFGGVSSFASPGNAASGSSIFGNAAFKFTSASTSPFANLSNSTSPFQPASTFSSTGLSASTSASSWTSPVVSSQSSSTLSPLSQSTVVVSSESTPSTNSTIPLPAVTSPSTSTSTTFNLIPPTSGNSVAPLFGQTGSTSSLTSQISTSTAVCTSAPVSTTVASSVFSSTSSSPSLFAQTSTSLFSKPTPATTATPVFGQPDVSTTVTSPATSQTTSVATPAAVTSSEQTPKPTSVAALFSQSSTPTTAVPLFGQSSTASTTSAAPVFGQSAAVTTSAPLFGQSSTTTAVPPFGQPTTVTKSSSLFGQNSATTTSTPLFGLIGQATTTTAAPPAFGLASTPTTTTASIFGQSTAVSSGKPLFGQTTPATATSSAPSLFGQTATTTTSLFGQNPSANTQSPFGQAAATTTPLFGQTTSSFGSPGFGSAPTFGTPQKSPSVFGGAPSFGSPTPVTTASSSLFSTPMFGQAAAQSSQASPFPSANPFFQTASSSVFGQTSISGNFGSSGGSLFGSNSSFSSPVQPGGNIFGGGNSGGAFSSPGSQTISQSGFGSPPSFQQPKPGGFGSSPVFGSTSAFGGTPAFGSQPSFGSPPKVFGSTSTSGGGFSSGQGTMFETLANQNSMTFGGLAQNQPQPNQQTPAFGAQQSPTFGGNAFSSWR